MKDDLRKAKQMLENSQLDSAKTLLERLLSTHPQEAEIAYLYGELLLRLDDVDKALHYLKQAISSVNSDPCWLVMGAVAQQRKGLYFEAENAFKAAELGGCKSDRYYYFCGNFHTNITKDFDRAEYNYLKLFRQNPKANVGLIALSHLYNLQHRYDESIQAAETCLKNGYESTEVYINLGAGLSHQGRQELALSCYKKALEIDPECKIAIQNYVQQLLFTEEDQEEIHRIVCELVKPLNSVTETGFNHHPKPDQYGRIRLGFVSADLYFHAIGFYLKPILENLDKNIFETFIYYNNVIKDPVTHRLKQVADNWRECMSLSDTELEACIKSDHIDILIDLSNHTLGNRLAVFTMKPVPIQIAWMGIPVSTCLKCMDYWIRDKRMISRLNSTQYASETLLEIDDLIVFEPIQELPDLKPPPFLQQGYITFGYYNGLRKATEPMFAVWAKILLEIQNAKIRIVIDDYENPSMREYIFDKFTQFGISRERVILQKRQPMLDYLKSYNEIDIALDPYPYSGQTTTMNALQMGVPVITCQGNAMASLYTATILDQLGKKKWIATDLQQYVQIAIDLAKDTQQLQQARNQLRNEVEEAYCHSIASTTKNVESALQRVWRSYCESREPTNK
jgi:predicted O-linked N-acetylglucosamine transferase (SPINDLY family)